MRKVRTMQGLPYISNSLLRILYNSKFILMAMSLGTNAVVVKRVHYLTVMPTAVAQVDAGLTGDQEAAGSTPAGSAAFFHGD